MKAGFYTPYLDSLGGGERYVLTLIEALNNYNWDTELFWNKDKVNLKAKNKFGINIDDTRYVRDVDLSINAKKLMKQKEFWEDYDLLFWTSDGSLPWMMAKNNIVHFQVPFHDVNGRSLINLLKKRFVNHFVVNSNFTKQMVDEEFGIESSIIYPPVAVEEFKVGEKKNAILYTARFSNLMQQKGHIVAIEAFKQLFNTGTTGFELWIAGSTEVGSEELINQLKSASEGYPIKFYTDLAWADLRNLYSSAQFFWSAVGYDADEYSEPEKCEHFGIALVEAMASGCIPIVINKGGYKEIIINERNGLIWNSLDELLNITTRLINDVNKVKLLRNAAVVRAADFSKSRFVNSWLRLLEVVV